VPIEQILLIDDNEADNVFHEIVLREAGFVGELRAFEMAAEALEFLRSLADSHPPTLIFLDINMPGMDGWEFARAAEPLLHGAPGVGVVMLTSSAHEGDRRHAESIAFIRGFLTKPLRSDRARELLRGASSMFALDTAILQPG
jgi:CheY-like chemotaxis protein